MRYDGQCTVQRSPHWFLVMYHHAPYLCIIIWVCHTQVTQTISRAYVLSLSSAFLGARPSSWLRRDAVQLQQYYRYLSER